MYCVYLKLKVASVPDRDFSLGSDQHPGLLVGRASHRRDSLGRVIVFVGLAHFVMELVAVQESVAFGGTYGGARRPIDSLCKYERNWNDGDGEIINYVGGGLQ